MSSDFEQMNAPSSAPQTVQMSLISGTRRLKDAGIDGAPRDARLLMAHVLGIDAGRITLHAPDEMSEDVLLAFDAAIARRVMREPVSHILGKRHFYGRDFIVTSDVLDPRPETEVLIEQALKCNFASVLDMGVGSGAILLTLLSENPDAHGLGSDLSEAAIAVAQCNAHQLEVGERVQFQTSDWFDAIEDGQTFDLVVSNPPYIATTEMPELSPELGYEPRMALTDEADGLTPYARIAARILEFLTPGGRILFEIGPTQAQAVSGYLKAAGCENIDVICDFDGRDRVVVAQAPSAN